MDRNQETAKRSSIDRESKLPKKKLKIDLEISSLSKEKEYSMREYRAIKAEYIEFNLSNSIVSIISRAAKNSALQNLNEKKTTMKLMISTAKDLALNEIESALWTIYLQKINWKNESNASTLDLIYTAYASKSFLNENLKPFSVYMETTLENFFENYKDWYSSHKKILEIDSKEINIRFKEYSKPYLGTEEIDMVNYNNCVDDILQSLGDYSSRDGDTTQSEDHDETIILREIPPIQLVRIKEEPSTQINPIWLLDTLSPELSDDKNNEKSPGTFDIFTHQLPLLNCEPSNMSEFQLFNEETPDFGTFSRAGSNSTLSWESNFPSNNLQALKKTEFEEGFPDC